MFHFITIFYILLIFMFSWNIIEMYKAEMLKMFLSSADFIVLSVQNNYIILPAKP